MFSPVLVLIYQLVQPEVQTRFLERSWIHAFSFCSAASVTATLVGLGASDSRDGFWRIGFSRRRLKLTWHSVEYMTDKCPVVVLGPIMMKKLGKEEMQVP